MRSIIYYNSHFISKRKSNDRLYRILIETGNYVLLKFLERTQRIYETKRKCKCADVNPQHLRRKGRVFIHIVCGGWYPYDLGVYLKNRDKKPKKYPVQHIHIATGRSY